MMTSTSAGLLPQEGVQFPHDTEIAELFLAYFERAPEYEALAYYRVLYDMLRAQAAEAGHGQEHARLQLSAILYETGAANGEIPAAVIEDNGEFVSYLYQNILGREADAGGHAHWLAALDAGMSRAGLVEIFLRAAEEDPRDAAYVGNRTEVALAFAEWQNSNPAILPDLKYNAAQVLEGVNEDPATVEDGMARLYEQQPQPQPPEPPPPPPPPLPEPKTFLLTPEEDHFVGTIRNDVFLAPAYHDGHGLAATLQTGDELDGAGGRDLLDADLYGSEATPTLTSIETLRVYNSASGTSAVLDLSQAQGQQTLEVLASTGEILVSHAGALQTIRVVGAQADVVAIEGISTTDRLRVDLEAVSQPDDWGTVWFGDEESTYAENGPWVMWADVLDLHVTDNTEGVYITNLGATTMNIVAQGENFVRFEANAAEVLRISGSGDLWLYESPIIGHFNLWGEYLRELDTTGFDGNLGGIWISDADDPAFAGAQIRLGGGYQTIGFDGAIAEGVTIAASTAPDSWTTLELMQRAYDSIAAFGAEQVVGVNALVLMEEAERADYELLHGATAFSFGWGIAHGHTATLHVGAEVDYVEMSGDMSRGWYDGGLIVQSEGVLEELDVYLANWAPGRGQGVEADVALEVTASELRIDIGQGMSYNYATEGSTTYFLELRDGLLPDDESGSIESIVFTGEQGVIFDLAKSSLGSSLATIDAGEMTGYFEVVLTGHQGLEVTGSQGMDIIVLDTTTDWSPDVNIIYGLDGATFDTVSFRLEGAYAPSHWNWDAIDVGDEATVADALEAAFNELDASAGGVAGWFVRDDFTYLLAKEELDGQEGRAAVALDGTGWDLWPDLLDGSTLDIWL
ncbi:MAG: DUF4214 domain-containing protein [Pigmentiphaga sp.]|nr:DUF4214 domain-containing protein [Pigmentiphaga sp.]